ncbi:MAG: signal peptidase I [Acidobacteriota bacterium]
MEPETQPTKRHWAREYFEALLIAGIFLGFSNTFVVKTFFIPSGSMEQTLLIGDHLFVNRFVYGASPGELEKTLLPMRDLARGDVVIFRSPQDPRTDLVKRCIGLPGDRVEIRRKVLYLNGEPVDDAGFAQRLDSTVYPPRPSPLISSSQRRRDNLPPFEVPEGHFFFLGDNRDHSYDSRYWGPVPQRYIKGRAVVVYWSYGGESAVGVAESATAQLERAVRTAGGLLTRTRWDRSFHIVR